MLEADEDTIEAAIDALVESGRLISQMMNGKEFLFLPQIYSAEKLAAQRILVMTKFPPAGRVTVEEDIEKIEKEENIHYESKQREAILTAANKGILILTGGPGTGKTTALNGILCLLYTSDAADD